jgi:hypothetical protein
MCSHDEIYVAYKMSRVICFELVTSVRSRLELPERALKRAMRLFSGHTVTRDSCVWFMRSLAAKETASTLVVRTILS